MNWFLLALVGPLLYALTNHIDKILLDRYFRVAGVGTLILYSSLLSLFAIPFILMGDSTVLDVGRKDIVLLTVVSALNVAVLWCYLLALKDDEATITIIFYQLVPVLSGIIGYFVLGEALSKRQMIAMAFIILGTAIVSLDFENRGSLRIRYRTVLFMLGAVTCWAIESVIFKAVALEANVWRSLFWEHLMMVVIGVLIFLCLPYYRKQFLKTFRDNSAAVISLNALNEGIYMLGNIVVAFAMMLAPVALVLLAESFQPVFVLVIGVILTAFFPRLSRENVRPVNMVQKLLAILFTGIGTYILLKNG